MCSPASAILLSSNMLYAILLDSSKPKKIFISRPPQILIWIFCVGAGFVGLWTHAKCQESVYAKSCTSHVVILGSCSILWTPKLQTEIHLSTLESEYIVMAQDMYEFIPLWSMHKEILGWSKLNPTKVFLSNAMSLKTTMVSRTLLRLPSCLPVPNTLPSNTTLFRIISTRIQQIISNILLFRRRLKWKTKKLTSFPKIWKKTVSLWLVI